MRYVVAGHREEKRLMFVYYEQVYLFSLFSVQLKNVFSVTNHASTFSQACPSKSTILWRENFC